MDLNVDTIKPDVPKWGETRFFGAYNPAQDVGIYMHAGRLRKDLRMWWVHLAAFLPGGVVIVDRSFGHDVDTRHVRTGCFELRQEDDGFHTTYDGVGEVTDTAALAKAPGGSGAGLARLKWDARFTEFGPLWDLYGGAGTGGVHDFAGDGHTQRSFTTTGSLTVDGQEYALDGVGWRDHSSGTRDWSIDYHGHQFILAVNDAWALHAISMLDAGGEPKASIGSFYHPDGTARPVEHFLTDKIADAEGGPTAGTIALRAQGEEEVTVQYELLHRLPIIINDNGDNMNGLDWDDPVLSIVLCESITRLTFPDGTVAHGFHERGAERSTLARP